jgi:hypothetical protein
VSRTLNNSKTDYNLETQLKNANTTDFPSIPTDIRDNTKSYPDRYDLFKTKLGEIHDKIELEATMKSVEDKIENGVLDNDLYDRITLLNKHGKGHVERVITHATHLAECIIDKDKKLSPFEIFILLCAIQIHDIGNRYGRETHTVSFKNDFEKNANESFITDPVLIKCIYNMAKVHGGKINKDADTLKAANLHPKTEVLGLSVRQRLLAAILRFADELADDSTRAFDMSKMPEYSKIYHAYSQSLHTVKIKKVESESVYFVKLGYFLNISEALFEYKKLEKDGDEEQKLTSTSLIREIIRRTIKMECERRYCARYFLPYFILKHITVEIEIDLGSFDGQEIIKYTLEETGYPSENIELPPTIEDNIVRLEKEYATAGGVK